MDFMDVHPETGEIAAEQDWCHECARVVTIIDSSVEEDPRDGHEFVAVTFDCMHSTH